MKKIMVFIIFMLVIISGCKKADYTEFEQEAEAEMEEKYQKDFTVLKTWRTGNEGFGYYPVSKMRCDDNGVEFHYGGGSDDYLTQYWSYEGTQDLKSFLEGKIEGDFEYRFVFSKRENQGMELMDYDEAIEHQKTSETGAVSTCNIFIFSNEPLDTKKEAKMIHNIYKEYFEERFNSNNNEMYFFLTIYYIREKYYETLNTNKINTSYGAEELYKEGKLISYISLREKSIINLENIEKAVKELPERITD